MTRAILGYEAATGFYRPLAIDANGYLHTTATLSADIEIGAVELKDGTTDARASIGAFGSLSALTIIEASILNSYDTLLLGYTAISTTSSLTSVIYKNGATTLATLYLGYDSAFNLSSVNRA
jgi:hypothetical protein